MGKLNEDLATERDRLDAENKRLAEDNITLNQEKQRLTEERSRLMPVWANTSVHQFDWNKYSVDSCKNEAIKAVMARQGVLNNQTPTSINFTLKGTSFSVGNILFRMIRLRTRSIVPGILCTRCVGPGCRSDSHSNFR